MSGTLFSLFFSFICILLRANPTLLILAPPTHRSLVGGPIGGSLVANYGYLGLSMFTGASMLAGSVLVAAARFGYNGILFAAV